MAMAAQRASGAAPAPVDWEPAWSSQHQRWFYQDRKNGLSAWSRPAGCTLELPREPPANNRSPGAAAQDLPPGWECEWDPKHKNYYYFNRKTRERQWKKPGGTKASVQPAAAAGVSAPAERKGAEDTDAGAEDTDAMPQAAAARREAKLQDAQPAPARVTRAVKLDTSPVSPEEYGLRRAQGAGEAKWDPEGFLERLRRAKATGDPDAVKVVRKEVAEHNYDIRHRWAVPRTTYVTAESCLKARAPSALVRDPVISFSEATTADAVQMLALGPSKHRVCALNFANGVRVGGGYKNGALAQEEDLCRRIPCLFTSLNNAMRDGYYPFGPSTCSSPTRPAKYSDVLWTPGVPVARAGEEEGFKLLPPDQQATVSLIAAAAPNIRFAKPRLDIKDTNLMYDTVKTIFLAPRMLEPELTTLVLGAWGCGAFGGDPREVSELFCRALAADGLGRLYREVHFAIPKGGNEDINADVFREALKRHKIAFRELSTAKRA